MNFVAENLKEMNKQIADIRKDYQKQSLLEKDVQSDPFSQFNAWWDDALKSELEEVNAMTLATASAAGMPAARIVLLKSVTGDGFVFFTNYNSHKADDLKENPNACLVFFWKELERQVRISGRVKKISAADSDEYYQSRPEASRIGAWASPQSQTIPSREIIEDNMEKYTAQFSGGNIERPPHWGGYVVMPEIVEFWQGRPNRLHDRLQYSLKEGAWVIERLAP